MSDKTITQVSLFPNLTGVGSTQMRRNRVAAYARVSTDNLDQKTSFAAQVDYYTRLIANHPEWEFVKIYSDDGVSGCSISKRTGFNQMMEDCEKGMIDLILTKSISRFARNTVDSLTAIRNLREKGIYIFFEKENLLTSDPKVEMLITIMSSLAEEESRSISENIRWGQRKRFADGKVSVSYSNFLGYDKGSEKYQMVVNEEQAVIVRRIYKMFLQGLSCVTIAVRLNQDKTPTPSGKGKWSPKTIRSILTNEKYKGDALLQKQVTVSFLTKKMKKNEGEIDQFYVHDDHEAIIEPHLFDYIQEIFVRRSKKITSSSNKKYSGTGFFCSKIICGKCGGFYGARPWHSTSYNNSVWQCRNRYNKSVNCKTVNIYDKYLHFIVHTLAVQRIKKMSDIKKIFMQCVSEVVGDERAAKIRNAMYRWLRSDIWQMWSDEDDLVMIIDHIVTHEDGKLELYWLDGSVDEFQMERFSPIMYNK